MISSSNDHNYSIAVHWAPQYSSILLEPCPTLTCPVKLPALGIAFSDDFPLLDPGQTLIPFRGMSKEDKLFMLPAQVHRLPAGCILQPLQFRQSDFMNLSVSPVLSRFSSIFFTSSEKLFAPKSLSRVVSVRHLERDCIKGNIIIRQNTVPQTTLICMGGPGKHQNGKRGRHPAINDWFLILVLTLWTFHNCSEPPSLNFEVFTRMYLTSLSVSTTTTLITMFTGEASQTHYVANAAQET